MKHTKRRGRPVAKAQFLPPRGVSLTRDIERSIQRIADEQGIAFAHVLRECVRFGLPEVEKAAGRRRERLAAAGGGAPPAGDPAAGDWGPGKVTTWSGGELVEPSDGGRADGTMADGRRQRGEA